MAGVSPGRMYNVETIRNALQEFFRAKVMLNCDRKGQLQEVSLFFYVEGRDEYVLTDALGKGTCHGPVWYPRK